MQGQGSAAAARAPASPGAETGRPSHTHAHGRATAGRRRLDSDAQHEGSNSRSAWLWLRSRGQALAFSSSFHTGLTKHRGALGSTVPDLSRYFMTVLSDSGEEAPEDLRAPPRGSPALCHLLVSIPQAALVSSHRVIWA